MHRLGAFARHLILDLAANRIWHSRAQLEVAQRGTQVEARSPDEDRPPAFGKQAIDLAMGELRVLAGAELVGCRHDPQQAVLELLAFAWAGGTAENRQALVDLDRVAGDRDGILAALAQLLGDGDRNGGLAYRGRPEEGKDPH